MTEKLDFDKPVQLRNGLPARIVSTHMAGEFSVATVITHPNGEEYVLRHTVDGRYQGGTSDFDLVNVPEKRTIWLNINENWHTVEYSSRELADQFARSDRIACVEVTYTKGEGL